MSRRAVRQVSLDYDKMFRTLQDIVAEEGRAHRIGAIDDDAPPVDRDSFVRHHSHAD
jgi:hypothetical protein